jgi:hypothetical protein
MLRRVWILNAIEPYDLIVTGGTKDERPDAQEPCDHSLLNGDSTNCG